MTPLTSPSGCVSCARLAVNITELKGRITALYQIKVLQLPVDSDYTTCHTWMLPLPQGSPLRTAFHTSATEASCPLSVHPSSSTQSSQVQFSPLTAPPPTMLIVGDAIIRHIKSKSAVTHCLPGAKVVDVLQQSLSLLSKHPLVHKIVVHTGTNNTTKQQSEL